MKLEVKNGSYAYKKDQYIFRNVSFSLGEKQILTVLGQNGIGKTTLLKCMMGILPWKSGGTYVDGVKLENPRKFKEIGYVPQAHPLSFSYTVRELVAMGRAKFVPPFAQPSKSDKERIEEAMEMAHVIDFADRKCTQLSGGQLQLAFVARALAGQPKVLILDEPASGMDPRARAEMKSILRSLKEMGKTVLISSHILPELTELCDSLTIIDHGKLVFSGSVSALDKKMNGNAPTDIRFVETTPEEMNRAVEMLRQYPGVTGIVQEEADLLRVELEGDAGVSADLLRALFNDGFRVSDYHRMPMNLEKVFMEVTQE